LIALLGLLVGHPALKHGRSSGGLSVGKIHAAVCISVRSWLEPVGSALAIRCGHLLRCCRCSYSAHPAKDVPTANKIKARILVAPGWNFTQLEPSGKGPQ
jgi:hypothetical protein